MTQTLAEYAAQKDAQNTIELNIRKYTLMLCECLLENFKSRNNGKVGGYDAPEYKFYIETARKYHKVWMDTGSSRSIHCFVDKKTGEVYKPASVKAPAKGVRYNMLLINSREEMFRRADWAGGYLYMRG